MNVWLIKEGNLTYSLNYTYLNNFKNHLVCILNAKMCVTMIYSQLLYPGCFSPSCGPGLKHAPNEGTEHKTPAVPL